MNAVNTVQVGYARCSTDEQDVVVQTEQLLGFGVPEDRFYIDRGFSGTTGRNRGGLDQALAAVWPDSVFTVTNFDRFHRPSCSRHPVTWRERSSRPAPEGSSSWTSPALAQRSRL